MRTRHLRIQEESTSTLLQRYRFHGPTPVHIDNTCLLPSGGFLKPRVVGPSFARPFDRLASTPAKSQSVPSGGYYRHRKEDFQPSFFFGCPLPTENRRTIIIIGQDEEKFFAGILPNWTSLLVREVKDAGGTVEEILGRIREEEGQVPWSCSKPTILLFLEKENRVDGDVGVCVRCVGMGSESVWAWERIVDAADGAFGCAEDRDCGYFQGFEDGG